MGVIRWAIALVQNLTDCLKLDSFSEDEGKYWQKHLAKIQTLFFSFKPLSYTASISFLVKSDQSSCNEGAPVPDWTDCSKLASSLKISDKRSSQIIHGTMVCF